MQISGSRVGLKPLQELDKAAWRRIQQHFRDPEIAHLNGTPPSRMPLWLLRPILKADSRRADRQTFGVMVRDGTELIGMTELYDLRDGEATLGIIIGEKDYWSRGFGTETVGLMLEFAFVELKLNQVQLSTFEDNLRAQASFNKAGFREFKRVAGRRNPDRKSVWMSISRDRWFDEVRKPSPQRIP